MRKRVVGKWIILLLLAIMVGFDAEIVAKERLDKAESLLDILEKRLLQKEQDTLSFGKQPAGEPAGGPRFKKYDTPTQVIQGRSIDITSALPGEEKLAELEKAVMELEMEVEQLSSDVGKLKGDVIDDSKLDNFTEISTKIADKEKIDIRSVDVKLDDYPITSIDRSLGLWSPQEQMLLFAGPLTPGDHKLRLSIRVVLKGADEALSLEKNLYYSMDKVFDVAVPTGKSRNKLTIVVGTPEKNQDNDKLALEQKATK